MSDPCSQAPRLAVLEGRDKMIQESLAELKANVNLILLQVTKVAVLEVNHNHSTEAMGRAFQQIKKNEDDITTLTTETREFMNTMKGMARMAWYLWGAMATGLGAVIIKLVFGTHV